MKGRLAKTLTRFSFLIEADKETRPWLIAKFLFFSGVGSKYRENRESVPYTSRPPGEALELGKDGGSDWVWVVCHSCWWLWVVRESESRVVFSTVKKGKILRRWCCCLFVSWLSMRAGGRMGVVIPVFNFCLSVRVRG